MTVREYLMHPKLFTGAKPTILNLSRSYAYQGAGYYASLLAEARQHRVVPVVETMIELSRKQLYQHALPELEDRLNRCLRKMEQGAVRDVSRIPRLSGQVGDVCWNPSRGCCSTGSGRPSWSGPGGRRLARHPPDPGRCRQGSVAGAGGFWPRSRATPRPGGRRSSAPDEIRPGGAVGPEGGTAAVVAIASLKHMAKVAARHGVEVVPIGRGDLDKLAQYDALFIRETTNIDNHTYRFARRAVQEGMPVIDDPVSMIRCTNKVYLTELLASHGIATPKTVVLSSLKEAGDLEARLGSPVVLKIPDGSFSRGVFKVAGAEAIQAKLKELFQDSDILHGPGILPDGLRLAHRRARRRAAVRLPVFDGQEALADRAPRGGKKSVEGGFKTVSLAEAPPAVVDIAVRAARLIGDGFYGVDLKVIGERVVVIEINDNPNLDHGVEDSPKRTRSGTG
jgi:glutathione synthase/RimK-type ligase-like ATP-grasp enzyme